MSVTKETITYELSLRMNSSAVGLEIMKNVLTRSGIHPSAVVELSRNSTTSLSIYFDAYRKAAALKRRLMGLDLKKVYIGVKSLKENEWKTKWKKDFKPFALTKNIRVVPAWLKGKYNSRGRRPIFIDTSLAFGTGMHATTRFMAQFIELKRGKFQSFLDIGTGTGILALIALGCGAKEVRAIDISGDAVKTARSNFLRNGYNSKGLKVLDFRKMQKEKCYDYVAANLTTADLIQMAKKIVSFVRPGQYLALSGISLNNYDMFRKCFDRLPLKCLKIEKAQGWIAVLYKKI